MSEEHTPGPWNFAFPQNPETKDDALDVGIFADVNGERKIIAEAFGQVNYDNVAPARANAMLIAAAPDLLAACKALLREQGDIQDFKALDAAVDQVYAAIAKATKQHGVNYGT